MIAALLLPLVVMDAPLPGKRCAEDRKSGVAWVDDALRAKFDAFVKKNPPPPSADVGVRAVLLVKPSGSFIHSREQVADGSGYTDIEYVDDTGKNLFVLRDCREGTAHTLNTPARNAAERSVRAFLLQEGYEPVLGITLGSFTRVRVEAKGNRAWIAFRLGDTDMKATSPPLYTLNDRDENVVGQCPGGDVHASAIVGASRLVVQTYLPIAESDGEGGGRVCATTPAAIVVDAGKAGAVVAVDGTPWTVETLPR